MACRRSLGGGSALNVLKCPASLSPSLVPEVSFLPLPCVLVDLTLYRPVGYGYTLYKTCPASWRAACDPPHHYILNEYTHRLSLMFTMTVQF